VENFLEAVRGRAVEAAQREGNAKQSCRGDARRRWH
jgi:hypothetical protein